MASLAWTDDAPRTLANVAPAGPGQRFRSWRPSVQSIGATEVGLGTGLIAHYAYRVDWTVTLTVSPIRLADLPTAQRLILHAVTGGAVTLTTDDSFAAVYATHLAPGTVPTLDGPDADFGEYALTITLRNDADAPFLYAP